MYTFIHSTAYILAVLLNSLPELLWYDSLECAVFTETIHVQRLIYS